jgi:hypothetical protein
MLLHVLAANCSHPQAVTSAEVMVSVLYGLSNINGKTLISVSFYKQTVLLKHILKLGYK